MILELGSQHMADRQWLQQLGASLEPDGEPRVALEVDLVASQVEVDVGDAADTLAGHLDD